MTLYRQLLLFTLALCFILFAVVWIDKLQSTRIFLVNQLESHAQDTATSLGLSISPFVAQGDMATIETMMNAIFDRGYYRTIILTDVNNAIVSQRVLDIAIDNVPPWFIKLIPLVTPGADSLIMDGWKRAGTIHVESHPGYAYQTLWQTAVMISVYFLLIGATVFVLGGLGLHLLLRPLRRVEKQAEAICRREYEIQERIPRTRELRQVVTSMNKMTAKVKEMFEEQVAIAEKFRESAFADALTGLGNRRFLAAQISAFMEENSKIAKGAFQLIQIHNLQEINLAKGYSAGDEIIKKAAHIIQKTAAPWAGAISARLNGGDFALFLPNIDKEDNERLAEEITIDLARLSVEQIALSDHICSLGGTFYNTPMTLEHLLAETDTMLHAARQAGPNQWKIAEPQISERATAVHGKMWWQETLQNALTNENIHLYAQRVATLPDREATLHLELFSRISLSATEEVHAGVFIPMAERSALITKLDRYVIDKLISAQSSWGPHDLAVNISATSLLDSAFMAWLISRLSGLPASASRIFFEFPEFSAVQHIDAMRDFSKMIGAAGHGIGLDHFGSSFSNFGHLKSLKPHYVKIDAAFTRELTTNNSDSYFFFSALKNVAHSLDINVIAEGVETQEQYEILQELSIDGLRGYFIEQPHRFLPST